VAIGFLEANGDPVLEIEVIGAFEQPTKFKCVVDTGFTGFLSIPLLQAFPVGLVLQGTMAMQFANGAVENKLVCLGFARVDGIQNIGLIVIENESKQVLLGMDFLKKFGFKLLVCPTTGQIELVPAANAFSIPAAHPVLSPVVNAPELPPSIDLV
jgi:predicted aspartyl protease